MSESYDKAKALFLKLCDLDLEARQEVLDRECGDDQELRAEVRSLLVHYERETSGLVGQDVEPTLPSEPRPRPPERIGAYRLIREIGRGGMGVVYLAVREDDRFKRRVAIKLLKRGMDTDDVLRRFDLERQLLAALNHPNIARLYDGGEAEDGRPYFVMEYIEGRPLDVYCDNQRRTIAERLGLFRAVCSAVHYAHQNLVVHRDLKPSNIIVTKEGVPKLLDFGIAKILNPELSVITGDPTLPEFRVMTPEYASPEQVRGDPITTSSDIYSLGVLLYELVSGHRPYHLRSRVRNEIQRVICEEDPENPSTAISRIEKTGEHDPDSGITSLITPESVAKVREGRPERLRRRLEGDIDNIVLMAMRKEPDRRYASAEQFADDIQRHLQGLPVIARHDTFAYRAVKFVHRNRAGVAAAAVIVLSLALGLAGTTAFWLRAESAQRSAEQARAEEQRQREVAEAEAARAQARSDDVRRLSRTIMIDVYDAVQRLDGATEARAILVETAREYLQGLESLIEGEDGPSPTLRQELATAYDRLGDVLGGFRNPSLGQIEEASQRHETALQMRRELHDRDPANATHRAELATSLAKRGDRLKRTGRTAEALDAYLQQKQLLEPISDRSDPDWMHRYAASLNNVGSVYVQLGDDEKAMESYEASLEVRKTLAAMEVEDDVRRRLYQRDLSSGHLRMGGQLRRAGDHDGMLMHYLAAQAIRRRLVEKYDDGRARRDLGTASMFVGDAYHTMGRPRDALDPLREALVLQQQHVEANPRSPRAHFDLVSVLYLLGDCRRLLGEDEAALARFEESRIALQPILNGRSPTTAHQAMDGSIHMGVGDLRLERGEHEEAAAEYEAAVAVFEALVELDPDDVQWPLDQARARVGLARALAVSGTPTAWRALADAESDLNEYLKRHPDQAGATTQLAIIQHELSSVLERMNDPGAVSYAERALQTLGRIEDTVSSAEIEALRRSIASDLERLRNGGD